MAKTQYSFSDDPKLKGAPTDFVISVDDIRASVGAGFVIPSRLGRLELNLTNVLRKQPLDLTQRSGLQIGLSTSPV